MVSNVIQQIGVTKHGATIDNNTSTPHFGSLLVFVARVYPAAVHTNQ